MATAAEISTRALKRLAIVDSHETPGAADMAHTSEALNAMIQGWEADGLSGDTLPLDPRFEQGLIAMLAVRVAEDFGKTPGPVLLRDADEGWARIQSAFFVVPKSRFENGLLNTTPGFDYAFNTTTVYPAWGPNTDYALRTFVVNGASLYECTTAGTSASSGSGPTGTGSTITDGAVIWCFRRVVEG